MVNTCGVNKYLILRMKLGMKNGGIKLIRLNQKILLKKIKMKKSYLILGLDGILLFILILA
jgi:hypothetical protein